MKLRLLRCFGSALALWLALAPAGRAAGSLEAEVEALDREYQKAGEEFYKVFRAAKTDAERQQIIAKYPRSDFFAGRFLDLARKDPKSGAAFRALAWVVEHAPFGEPFEQAAQMLVLNQLDNPQLGNVLAGVTRLPGESVEMLLRAALANSPHREVQARACLCLARWLRDNEQEAEAERLFERTVKDYGGVVSQPERGKFGEIARRELDAMRNLRIGAVAPEIEGKDVDGQPMKLSGFRGKVVVLSFWGSG